MGIPKEQTAIINSWVSRQIKLGRLTETLLKFDRNHNPEYEYHYFENKIAHPVKKRPIKTTITKEVLAKANKIDTQVAKPEQSNQTSQELNIPIDKDLLNGGLSLTLNINFIINK